jgi:hypothetical protein
MLAAAVSAQGQREVRVEDLTAFGLKLPPSFPTLTDLANYQRGLKTSQVIKVQWDSMNGLREPMAKEGSRKYADVAGKFTLIEQSKQQPFSPGGLETEMPNRLLVVGRSASGEVRCMKTVHDPREMHGEFFNTGKAERYDFVRPFVEIRVDFCNDLSMTTLEFIQLDPWSKTQPLKRLGSVALVAKPPTGP